MIDDDFDDYKSRSQKKRESTAIQKIGTELTALSKADLETLGLPEDLFDALLDWKKFPGHEAKRRQMQYIGRIMRDMDLTAIEDALKARLAPSRAEIKRMHDIEALRDSLLTANEQERESILMDIAARHSAAPITRLRHLCVAVGAERAGKKPPKAYRELFRLLRDMGEDTGTHPVQE